MNNDITINSYPHEPRFIFDARCSLGIFFLKISNFFFKSPGVVAKVTTSKTVEV